MQWFLLISLIFYTRWTLVNCANCNVCSVDNNLACVSETQFSVCVDGLPTATTTSCPTGYVCSTASMSICELDEGQDVIGDCTDCNTCDETSTFACTGLRTYALCLGTTTLSDLGGTCAPDYVCSIDFPFICGSSELGIQGTCASVGGTETTTTTEITTTESQIVSVTNPVAYCQTLQQNGRFPAGNDLTTTCKQYVHCFVNSNAWSGALYFCPGATFFNSSSRYCTPNIPARCLGNTQRLALRNIDLNF